MKDLERGAKIKNQFVVVNVEDVILVSQQRKGQTEAAFQRHIVKPPEIPAQFKSCSHKAVGEIEGGIVMKSISSIAVIDKPSGVNGFYKKWNVAQAPLGLPYGKAIFR